MSNEYDEEHDAPDEIPNEITEEVRNMTPSFKMVDVNKYFDLIKYRPYGKQWLYHKSKTRFKIINAGRRAGKALDIETLLPSPDALSGFISMKDVQVGDRLFDENGKPTTVLAISDIMYDHDCYMVTFGDGNTIIADAEHLWLSHTKRYRKSKDPNRKTRQPELLTTEEIKATLFYGLDKPEYNHVIPMSGPLEYPVQDLPIDPYVLGVWLGDGTSNDGTLTSNDIEIIEEIRKCGYNVVKLKNKYRYNIHGLWTQLKNNWLLKDKHIPPEYMISSIEQRLALIQGLMDTDGHAGGRYNEFCSTKLELAQDFLQLSLSLGLRAVLIEGRATLNGVDYGPKYRVFLNGELPLYRLPRKLNIQMAKKRNNQSKLRSIVAVTKVDSRPVKCVQVSSKSKLYLASKACIPTHNTIMVGKNVQPLLLVPNKRIWGVGPSYCVAKDTEILTRRGWLKYDELVKGDETLTLNTSGLAEWQNVDSVHIFDGQHDMISMEWRGHSSLTTRNHRWLVGYITKNTSHGGAETLGFRFTTTENLKKENEYVLCAAPVTNLPTEQKYTDAFVELVAWYWTEGCDRTTSNGILISQNRGPNSNRISAALTSLFGDPSDIKQMQNRIDKVPRWSDWKTIDGLDRCGNFSLNTHAGVLFRDVAPDKIVSAEFIASLTKSQLELFINISVMADGHSRERDGLRGRERGVVQNRKDRLDPLQMACQLAGYQTNLVYQQSRDMYWLAIFERNKILPGGRSQKTKHKDVKYNGVVWCPKTSNGTWLARRNGTVYFTGNTLGEKEFRVVWDDMIVRLGFGKDKRVKKAYNIKQGNMFIELPWNTRFEVRSAERPDYLVGDSLDHVIMSEAAIHNSETWYRYIQPALSDRRGTADFPSTPRGMNWYHKLWQYGQNPDYVEFECVDEKTEIFTKRGWLNFKELIIGDETLSINPSTGLSEWDTIEKINKYDGIHRLVRMESTHFSALTTKNHRWLTNVSSERGRFQGIRSGWRWRTTEKLTKDDRIPKATPCSEIPTEAKYKDEFVELVAWIWTEGDVNSNNKTSFGISQSSDVNPANILRIRRALQQLCPNPIDGRVGNGGYWSENEYLTKDEKFVTKFYLGKELSESFWTVFDSHKVVKPEFILSLTKAQLKLFVDVSILGDGCNYNTTTYISQKNQKQLQAVQMACCLLGFPTSIRRNQTTDGSIYWKLHISKQLFINPKQAAYNAKNDSDRRAYVKGMEINEEEYTGIVWCPKTRNGNWLARRSGSVYYTGNSWQYPSWANQIIYPGGRQDPEILLMERTLPHDEFLQEIAADFTSFAGKIYCYDDKTEILTSTGFKNILEVEVGELVATLTDDGEMLFIPCTNAFKYKYKGKMLLHEERVINFCVTPNHKMWLKNYDGRRETNYKFVEASKLKKLTVHNKSNCSWFGNDGESIVFTELNKNHRTKSFKFAISDWVEFLGWYISEGSIENEYSFMIGQLKDRPRYVEIKELLDRMGISYYEHDNGLRCSGKLLVAFLKKLGKSKDRFIPKDILNMNTKYLKLMLNALMKGDGHITKDGQRVYATISKQLADDFQELCLRLGLAVNISYITNCPNPYYRLNIFKNLHNESIVRTSNIKEIDYDGFVGCVTVDPYHRVFVRRDGKGMWCGNSEFDETIHVRKCTYNPAWRNYIAFDFGYVNPLAAIEFQVDPMDRVHVWREHYKDRIILEDHLDILRNRVQPPGYKIDLCFGDAADPGAIETISSYFAPCWGDPKSKDDWMEGVRLVKSFLKQQEVGVIDEYGTPKLEPWLFVDHSCENTIREFNNYRSAPKVTNRNETNLRESAQKYDDHALDALRYGMVHIFKLGANVSIQSVVGKGDLKKIEDGGFFKGSSLFQTVGGLFNNNKRF